jgi:hypothetical protein
MPNKSLTRKGKRTPGANVRKLGWWSRIAKLDTSHTNIWIFGQTQAGIWRTAWWAAQRAKGLKQVISIPTLIRNAHEAHTLREKAEILKQAHFPPPVEADLSDLEGYSYPERVFIPERLGENEALNVIKELAKDKVPGLDKIPNRILKRVVNAALTLITRIF